MTALGLTGACLSRYEAVLLLFVIGPAVLIVDWMRRGRWEAVTSTVLAGGPAAWGIFLWFMYQRIITGSFTTFRRGGAETSGGGGTPTYLHRRHRQHRRSPRPTCVDWVIPYFPLLLLLVPLLLVPAAAAQRRRAHPARWRAASLLFPTYYLLTINGTYAQPPVLRQRPGDGGAGHGLGGLPAPGAGLGRLLIDPALVALIVLSGFTATTALQDKVRTQTEGEFRVFQLAEGIYDDSETANGLDSWAVLVDDLDTLLGPGRLVLADARYSYQAALLTLQARPVHHQQRPRLRAHRGRARATRTPGSTTRSSRRRRLVAASWASSTTPCAS